MHLASAPVTYYNTKEKQVNIRAKGLQREYTRKAQEIDRKYCGTERDMVGPLESHLHDFGDLLGLVVGQYGEGSQGLHDLLGHIVSSRAEYVSRSRGSPLSAYEHSCILGGYRRRLSVTAVRCQAKCLLARLGHLGPAADQAAQRRAQIRVSEQAQRTVLRANFEAYVRGKRPHSIGNLHP